MAGRTPGTGRGVPQRRVSLLIDLDLYEWLVSRQCTLRHKTFSSYVNVLLASFRDQKSAVAAAAGASSERSEP